MSVKLFTVEKDASGNLVPGVDVKTLTEGAASSRDQYLYTKDGTTHKFELKIEDGTAYMLVSTYEVLAAVTEDVPMYKKSPYISWSSIPRRAAGGGDRGAVRGHGRRHMAL